MIDLEEVGFVIGFSWLVCLEFKELDLGYLGTRFCFDIKVIEFL